MAAEHEEVIGFKPDADIVAGPLGGGKRVPRHRADHFKVALLVAPDIGVLSVAFGGVIKNPEFRLDPVPSGIHFSAGDQGVAADCRHLFQHHDARPGVLRLNRGREPSAAGTHDDHVIGALRRNHRGRFLKRLLSVLRERHARLLRRALHGREKAFR